MKVLIIESIAASPHLETSGEIALRLQAEKHDVSFSWVGFNLPWNDWELGTFKKVLGGSYKKKVEEFTRVLLKKGIKINGKNYLINYKKIYEWSRKFNGNLSQLKNYKYDNCKLGAGVASSIISHFKNIEINLSQNKNKIKLLLYAAGIVYERSKKTLQLNKPDKIYTFNNRFATCYPIICAAQKLKIQTIRHERGSNKFKFEMYEKDVHDLDLTQKKILQYWKNNKDKNKIKKAKKYFKDKINSKLNNFDHNIVYTKKQIKDYLPDLPLNKRIVTFFTSRDYEKASIVNMEFDQLKEFKKFKKIINKFNDIHLVIRVHPSFDNKICNDDYEWEKFNSKNTTIIKSFESYDTYALMFKSDIIVTYTSSIIVESAYYKKPSVSIGKFWWSGLDIADEPRSTNELKNMLNKDYKFRKKNTNNCLKIANYFLNFGTKYKYYKPITLTTGIFLGKKLTWKSKFILFIENIFKKII